MIDMTELNKLRKIVESEVLSDDEKKKLGLVENDFSVIEDRMVRHAEDSIALMEGEIGSQSLEPLKRSQDRRELKPWLGKVADGEIAFRFERMSDAQDLYDFIVDVGLLEDGEIKLHLSDGQYSVHFMPHVAVVKPDVIQAAMIAYEDIVSADSMDAYESLAEDIKHILVEKKAFKVAGAPKGKYKGNPFHDKNTGKFVGAGLINISDGGSWAIGKRKLKFTGSKKGKDGGVVVSFGSTKHPCGRAARKKGKDIRCWDGEKGKGIPLSKAMKKKSRGEDFTDDDLRSLLEAVNYVNKMAENIG